MIKRSVEWLASAIALLGGAVLIALVVMTCVSVFGRTFSFAGLRPIPGDYELVEIGVGFAVFAALPWCHLNRGNASVELLAPMFGATMNRVLDLIIDLLVLAVALLITWRLTLGMLDKRSFFETTFILQIEIWQAYALGLAGAVIFCIVAVYRCGISLAALSARAVNEQS